MYSINDAMIYKWWILAHIKFNNTKSQTLGNWRGAHSFRSLASIMPISFMTDTHSAKYYQSIPLVFQHGEHEHHLARQCSTINNRKYQLHDHETSSCGQFWAAPKVPISYYINLFFSGSVQLEFKYTSNAYATFT